MRRFAEVAKACVLDAATCAAGGFARETRDAWRAIADATRAPFLDRMNGALAADADAAARPMLHCNDKCNVVESVASPGISNTALPAVSSSPAVRQLPTPLHRIQVARPGRAVARELPNPPPRGPRAGALFGA
jgi:hypothetical protein